MNSTLDIALAELNKYPCLHLFPVEFGNKGQPLLKDYLNRASNDPARIREWHSYWKRKFKGVQCWWGIRERPLHRFPFIPRCAHPNIAFVPRPAVKSTRQAANSRAIMALTHF